MTLRCPKCGSVNTRNSKGNKFLKGVGEFTASFLVSPTRSIAIQNAAGRILGGTLGLFWHKRVCRKCGYSWWHEIDTDYYDD